MGVGTTGVESIKLDRRFVGIELNSVYFKIAQERMENGSNETIEHQDMFCFE